MCFININIIIIIIRYSVVIVFLCGISSKIVGTLSKDEDDGSENDGKKIKIENTYTQSISKYIQGILVLHYQKTRIFFPFSFHDLQGKLNLIMCGIAFFAHF